MEILEEKKIDKSTAAVIIRHGYNTANAQGPVAVLPSREEAEEVLPEIECYNNQWVEIKPYCRLSKAEREQADELTIVETLACCGRKLQRWEIEELDGCYLATGECAECWRKSIED